MGEKKAALAKQESQRESRYEIKKRLYSATADLDYCLEVFGEELAKREGYKGLDGLEAIHFFLIRKFHWLPRDVRSMSKEDLRLVLSQETAGWTLPKEARVEPE